MFPSTENLLKIRDGEPIDADALAYVEADPSARAELHRLRETRRALNDLPTIEPPSGSWDKIVAAVDLDTSRTPSPDWRWPLRAAIAASRLPTPFHPLVTRVSRRNLKWAGLRAAHADGRLGAGGRAAQYAHRRGVGTRHAGRGRLLLRRAGLSDNPELLIR